MQVVLRLLDMLPRLDSGIRVRLIMLYVVQYSGIGPESRRLLDTLSATEQVRCCMWWRTANAGAHAHVAALLCAPERNLPRIFRYLPN
jgi:hypothetical protein